MKRLCSHVGRIVGSILCSCGEPVHEVVAGGKKYMCHNTKCQWFGRSFTAIVERGVLLYEVERGGSGEGTPF